MSGLYAVSGNDLTGLADDLREASGQSGSLTWPQGFRAAAQNSGTRLPDVTTDDNGKVLGVVNGEWDKTEAANGIFTVTVTAESDPEDVESTVYVCDKSYASILAAYNAGTLIYVLFTSADLVTEKFTDANFVDMPSPLHRSFIEFRRVSGGATITSDLLKIFDDDSIDFTSVDASYVYNPGGGNKGQILTHTDDSVVWADPSGGLDASGANEGEVPVADGSGNWSWLTPDGLDASGANAGEVPTANGNDGWAWVVPDNPLVILNMTSSGLLPVNAALFSAFQSFLKDAVAAPGTVVRAEQSVNTGNFLLALMDAVNSSPVALQFSAGAGSEMLLTVTAFSQECAALRVAMAYTIANMGTFDLAGDAIIGNNKVIIMGYALAEPTT